MRLSALVVLMFAMLSLANGAVTIGGSVVDETDNPVAGARVVVLAPETSSGVLAAVTSDAAGAFRLELPAAGDYRMRVEREGYFLLTSKVTRLDPASPVDVHLNHLKELAESIDVPYSPPVVDPDQTTQVKRLDSPAILNLPWQQLQLVAPRVHDIRS